MATNLGYGGTNYGTANKDTRNKIVQNQSNIANNQGYKQDEINRTLQVIANRKNQGMDTSAQQKYLNVNLGYKEPNVSPMVQAAQNTTQQAVYTPPTSRADSTLNSMGDFAKQLPYQFKGPTEFTYDPQNDPAYISQLAEARKNVATQQSNTNAQLRATGQGKSSWSESVANQIGTNAMDSIANNLVPTLMNQAYQRYTDNANRDLQVQQLNYGAQQDQLSNLANLFANQYQYDVTRPMQEAELTGNYLPGEARQAITNLLNLKQQAESPGITAQERSGLSKQADAIRAQLQALGIDPSGYGANVSSATARNNNQGIRTLQGQQLDLARQGQQFNQDFSKQQFGYQQARDLIQDQQWKAQFDRDVSQFGLQFALNQQVQLGNLSNDQARLALQREAQEDGSLRDWATFGWQMGQNGKYAGMSIPQVVSSATKLFGQGDGDNITIPNDPETKRRIYDYVAGMNMPDGLDDQALFALGLTKEDVDNLYNEDLKKSKN
jgi:hypothetical protein